MIDELGFTVLIYLIWVLFTGYGLLILYWFVVQGFSEEGYATGDAFPLEDRSYTKQSLMIWAVFFGAIVLMIILGG